MNDRLRKFIPLTILAIGAYLGWVILDTELRVYRINAAAKRACTEKILLEVDPTNLGDEDPRAKKRQRTFLSRVREHDVKVGDDDATFTPTKPCYFSKDPSKLVNCECEYSVLFSAQTEWPILSDAFDLKPWTRVGEKTGSVPYRATY